MVAAEATKVNGVVITSSPGPIPAASNARCNALVPEFTPTASAAPQYPANSFSNAATSGPRLYWALRSRSGIIFISRGGRGVVSADLPSYGARTEVRNGAVSQRRGCLEIQHQVVSAGELWRGRPFIPEGIRGRA